jgi:hypothetical protein
MSVPGRQPQRILDVTSIPGLRSAHYPGTDLWSPTNHHAPGAVGRRWAARPEASGGAVVAPRGSWTARDLKKRAYVLAQARTRNKARRGALFLPAARVLRCSGLPVARAGGPRASTKHARQPVPRTT